MPFYKFKLDDGRSGRFEAKDDEDAGIVYKTKVLPDMMRRAGDVNGVVQDAPPQPPAPEGWPSRYDKGGTAPPPDVAPPPVAPPPPAPPKDYTPSPEKIAAQRAADKKLYDPAAGMPWYEKATVGAIGGAQAASVGVRDVASKVLPWIPAPHEKELEAREEWDKLKEPLGGWGTAGEIGGETLVTAPIGGPVAKGVGKVVTSVLPKATEIAKMGGKYINAGTFGNSAVQGAVQGGAVGESTDRSLADRADDVAKGLGLGLAGPAVLKLAALPVKLVTGPLGVVKAMLAPTATQLEQKIYDTIERTIGKDAMADAYRAMTNAGPSMVPHTTAAMAESAPLGALERGARGRSLGGDFASHDESVARATWDMLNDIPPRARTEAGQVLKDTFQRNGVAQTAKVFGKGEEQVPDISSLGLRKALGKLSPHLSDVEKDTFFKLADDLTQKDIVKTGAGSTSPAGGGMRHLVSSGLALASAKFNSPAIWKVRSAFNTISGNAEDKVTKGVDQALLDPDKFMNMVENIKTKVATDLPLTDTEQLMKQAMEMAATTGGRAAAAAPTTQPDKPKRY